MTKKQELLEFVCGLTEEQINKLFARLDELERVRDTESNEYLGVEGKRAGAA